MKRFVKPVRRGTPSGPDPRRIVRRMEREQAALRVELSDARRKLDEIATKQDSKPLETR